MRQFAGLLIATLLFMSLTVPAYAGEKEDDDTIAPELLSVAVDRERAYPGGQVTVSAMAQDDDSGVASIQVFFCAPSGGTPLSVKLLRNSNLDIQAEYSGILKIPQDAETGEYRLLRVSVLDRDGNRAQYFSGDSGRQGSRTLPRERRHTFSVVSGGPPPGPVSCSVSSRDGQYTLTLHMAQSEAGLEKATLLFENPENFHKLALTVGEDDLALDGRYRQDFALSTYEPSGLFVLKQIAVKDRAGGKQTWSTAADSEESNDLPLSVTASFSVSSSSADDEPPTLLQIKAGAGLRDNDDEKTRYPLWVKATDDRCGIEHITVKFRDPVSGESFGKVLRGSDAQKDGWFKGEVAVKFEQVPGQYRLDSVTLCDRAGNRITYCTQADLTDKKRLLPEMATISVN